MKLKIKREKNINILFIFENILFCIILMRGMGAPGNFAAIIPNSIASLWYNVNLGALLILLIIATCKSKGRILKKSLVIFLFGSYVLISGLIISNFSQMVIEDSVMLLLTVACSVYIGSMRKKEEMIKLLVISQIIISLMIIYMIVIGYDGVAVADGYYSFNLIGLYTTKNSCGYELVFGALLFYYCFRGNKKFCSKIFWFALFCGQTVLAFYARTVGAIATEFCVIILYEIILKKKDKINLANYYLGINAAFWIFVGFILPSASFILQKVGKSVTLTGRTIIWKAILTFIDGINTWFGYGYGGFWSNEKYTKLLYAVYNQFALRSGLVGGHNLFMELYINIGVVGVVIFIIMVYSILKESIRYSVNEVDFEVVCLSFLAIRGLMERTLNSTTYDTIVLFMVLGTLIHMVGRKKVNEGINIEKKKK